MNFTNIRKITSFTEIIAKVRNHKNGKLVKNKPERLWPLEIQNKYNKYETFKHTQMQNKS